MGLFRKSKPAPDMVLSIPQMSCGHCEQRISHLLKQVDVVKDVTANASSKEAQVYGTASFDQLAQALEGTGYNPSRKD